MKSAINWQVSESITRIISLRSRSGSQMSGVCSRWKPSKASENATVSWQSYNVSFLGCARYNLHRLPWKGKIYQQRLLYWVIGAKLSELGYELLPHPPYSPDLAPSDKSFYKHGIEKLEKRWDDCIALEGDYIDE